MVALNDVRVSLLQPRDDVIGELVFENAVSEAQQFIDISDCRSARSRP